eukprot:2252166-Prymnesium_polylepis.1
MCIRDRRRVDPQAGDCSGQLVAHHRDALGVATLLGKRLAEGVQVEELVHFEAVECVRGDEVSLHRAPDVREDKVEDERELPPERENEEARPPP